MGELPEVLREAAQTRHKGKDQDRGHQGVSPSDAVGDDPEGDSAESRGEEGDGSEEARLGGRKVPFLHDGGQGEDVQEYIEGVEAPSHHGGHQRIPLGIW